MTKCAEHVDFQLPNKLTCVTYLLDAIEHNNAELQAAMALVQNDTGPTGKMSNFEATAAFLLPKDPVARKCLQAKRAIGQISSVDLNMMLKPGIRLTGVALHYHTQAEYLKLSAAQKTELHKYRK